MILIDGASQQRQAYLFWKKLCKDLSSCTTQFPEYVFLDDIFLDYVRYNISSHILNMSTNPCTRNSIFNIIMLSYLCFWSTSEWNLLCWLHCICLECFHCIMWVCKMENTNCLGLAIGVPTHISVVVAFMYPLQPSNTHSFMLPMLKSLLENRL